VPGSTLGASDYSARVGVASGLSVIIGWPIRGGVARGLPVTYQSKVRPWSQVSLLPTKIA